MMRSNPSRMLSPPGWRRRMVRLGSAVLCCYVGVLIVLLLLENKLLFHPIRAAEEWLAPPNRHVQDIELPIAGGVSIHAWWCPVANALPAGGAILHCHGNAGNLSHRAELVACWQEQLGLPVLIFDYPGYGKSSGKPSEAGC